MSKTIDQMSSKRDVWKWWDRVFSVVFYIATLVPTLIYSRQADTSPQNAWMAIFFVGIVVVMHTILIFSPARNRDRKYLWGYVLYTVLFLIVWMALLSLSPTFFFFMFSLPGEINRWLPWRFSIVLNFVMIGYYIANSLNVPTLELFNVTNYPFWIAFIAFAVMITLSGLIDSIISQSAAQNELIAKLQATQSALAATERQQGILQERQRLAHEIHDTLAQSITSIIMHLEAADQAKSQPIKARHHLAQAQRTARTSLDQARRVVKDLRPKPLEESTFADAIKRAVSQFSAETSVQATLIITGDYEELHPEVEVTLLRATQEALTNIRKHAQASEVSVTLSYLGDVVILDVQDNGVGLQASETPSYKSGGFGIKAMRERVSQFRGNVMLESEPGEGTTLVVEIPLSPQFEEVA